MTPQEKFELAAELSYELRAATSAGVARDLPDASDEEKFEEYLRRWLGEPLATKVIECRRQRIAEGHTLTPRVPGLGSQPQIGREEPRGSGAAGSEWWRDPT